MSYPDFCAVEYNKDELWYETTKDFTGEARKCPPQKGVVIPINEAKVFAQYDFPSRLEEGPYKCDIEISMNKKKMYCFSLFFEIKEV